jgi:NADH:ubiquinone oxidoreductase subunit E
MRLKIARRRLEPKGKHVIRICDGTACHVKQSLPVLNALHEKLGTSEKHKTTVDMLFTVETVATQAASTSTLGFDPATVERGGSRRPQP